MGDVDWDLVYNKEGKKEEDYLITGENTGKLAAVYYVPLIKEHDNGEEIVGNVGKTITEEIHGSTSTAHFPLSSFVPPTDFFRDPQINELQFIPTESVYRGIENEDDLPSGIRINDPHPKDTSIAPPGHPPIRLTVPTSTKTSPGNYEINFVFTYKEDGMIKQSSRSSEIHVKNWVERNNRLLQLSAILVSLSIALTAVFSYFGI